MSLTRVAAQQPYYLPDFYYFFKIFYSDIFLISDFLGFRKQSPIVRANFGDFFLTIPVHHHKSNPHPVLTEVEMLDPGLWRDKHLKTLSSKFSGLPFFEHYFPYLVEIFKQQENSLNKFLASIILWQVKLVMPHRDVLVCSENKIKNLKMLRVWLEQYSERQWLIYPNEKQYYVNHFPTTPLLDIQHINGSSFPSSYHPTIPLLKLLFLRGPESVIYFEKAIEDLRRTGIE